MSVESCFRLTADDADALGWVDLSDDKPLPLPSDSSDRPSFLGVVHASQHHAYGVLSLDVQLDPTGQWLDIGAYRFALSEALYLCSLIDLAKAVALPCRSPASPPWEGETRP